MAAVDRSLIEKLPLFAGLDAAELDAIVSEARSARYAKNTAVFEQGVDYWPLAMTRALDDLVLRLRTNEQELGTWVFRTEGDSELVLAHDRQLRPVAARQAPARLVAAEA